MGVSLVLCLTFYSPYTCAHTYMHVVAMYVCVFIHTAGVAHHAQTMTISVDPSRCLCGGGGDDLGICSAACLH